MNNHINIVYDSQDVRKKAGVFLSDFLHRMMERKVLLLLSSGSWLLPLEDISRDVLGKNLTIGLIDERFTQNPRDWNRIALEETNFFTKVKENKCTFILPVFNGVESIEKITNLYENDIRDWKKKNPQGIVVATLGVGTDGHTAGILPKPDNLKLFMDLFYDQNKWFAGYKTESGSQFPSRITATIPFLKTVVDYGLVYASGLEKSEAVQKVFREFGDTHHTPARIIRGMKQVTFFTDQKII